MCDKSIYDELLNTIICYYCTELTKKSVHQCVVCDYRICRDCLKRIPYCPRCSHRANKWIPEVGFARDAIEDIPVVKNATLHQHVEQQQQQYRQQDKWIYPKQRQLQQQQQQQQQQQTEPCPLKYYEDCTWVGHTKKDIIRHCDRNHSNLIFHTTRHIIRCIDFDLNDSKTKDVCLIFVAYNELFHLYFHGNYATNQCRWQCGYYGIRRFSKRFHFEITFQKVYQCNDEITIRAPCQYLNRYHHTKEPSTHRFVNDDNFVILSFTTLKTYCYEKDLYFSIKIIDMANITNQQQQRRRTNHTNQIFNCQRC